MVCLRHWWLWLSVVTFGAGSVNRVKAWHDEGHMLVAAVAKEYLKPETVEKIEYILSEWSPQYPTTSTLETAAVWLDHVACSMPGRYCRGFLGLDDIRIFKPWHYTSNVFNPQNLTLEPLYEVQPYPQTGSSWILLKSYESLRNCTGDSRASQKGKKKDTATQEGREEEAVPGLSPDFLPASLSSSFFPLLRVSSEKLAAFLPWILTPSSQDSGNDFPVSGASSSFSSPSSRNAESNLSDLVDPHGESAKKATIYPETSVVCSRLSLNLHLRLLLHIYGDAHQPLHATETYSKAFPNGDFGGNNISIVLPRSEKMLENYPSTPEEFAEVGAEAHRESGVPHRQSLHSQWDGAFGQYNSLFYEVDLDELKKEAQRLVRLYPVDEHAKRTFADFHGISIESSMLARSHVFSEFEWSTFSASSLPYHPSVEYIEKSKKVCEKQIALAGARLALLLESLSASLPSPPPVFHPQASHSSLSSSILDGDGKVELRSACTASEDSLCFSVKKHNEAPLLLFAGPSMCLESAGMALVYSRPLAVLFLCSCAALLALGLLLFWTCRQLRFYKAAVSLTTTAGVQRPETESTGLHAPATNYFRFFTPATLTRGSAIASQCTSVNSEVAMATRLLENRETMQRG
ncbi:S1/P1 nuclease [Toxoplasma gondii RUB]|uniref:S1/P1 nuclease n=2 Tax=Toxoplasma gondii TaxID=5811 RepID=A0A086M3A3_TOXGO|nr:S1/P1 nuclease [Toxoplasma gondii RUB]KFH08247.1 S1/P1 nuclease [Toxoplasma gondii VAND]